MKSQSELPFAKKSTWMNDAAKVITIVTIGLSVIGIIGYSVDLYRHGQQKHYIGWFSSAGFVLLTVPISVRLIVMHLTHWYSPNIQKYVVRIIWMVPIYSVESWLALRFKSLALYIETARECYEAYVIFSFLYFLIALLGDEQQIVAKLKVKSAEYGRHRWPYVVIKNLSAIVVCVLASFGYYREGTFRLDEGYIYQCVVCNMSQLWALYCLVLFYFATKEELTPWRPVGKFLCVKLVVFFTWWQSIAISVLASMDLLDSSSEDNWTVTEISKGLQDYLICVEMFLASIAFSYAFTYQDYASSAMHGKGGATGKQDWEDEDVEASKPFLSALLQSAVPDDIFSDISKQFYRGASTPHMTRKSSNDNASDQLILDTLSATPTKDTGVGAVAPPSSKHSIELLRKDSSRVVAVNHTSSNIQGLHVVDSVFINNSSSLSANCNALRGASPSLLEVRLNLTGSGRDPAALDGSVNVSHHLKGRAEPIVSLADSFREHDHDQDENCRDEMEGDVDES